MFSLKLHLPFVESKKGDFSRLIACTGIAVSDLFLLDIAGT